MLTGQKDRTYSPVIIIGAPRSGTNLLRDILTSLDGIATWPCDEINYIWRHGNARYQSDEFPADFARPDVCRYITKQFAKLACASNAAFIVEKTCANSLRVPFVHRVTPTAKFIYIYRDGIDAAASALLRWKAPLDIPYILRKARYVPITDLPWYCGNYFFSRVYRLFSGEQRLATWGPRLHDMQALLKQHSLIEVCALQWQRCVDSAESALETLPAEQVCRLNYCDLVRYPAEQTGRILQFLGHSVSPDALHNAVSNVRSSSLGKSQSTLSAGEIAGLRALIGRTLERHGNR